MNPPGKKPGDPRSRPRGKRVRVKTARGRSNSSARWLQRHFNDPFVAEARRLGYRSRAAFKLEWLDEKFGFLKSARRILDLGAAPGGWTQIAAQRARRKAGQDARILAVDILPMEPVTGAEVLRLDILDEKAPEIIKQALGGKADVVMSDMANSATGHKNTDHLRTLVLLEAAYDLAGDVLAEGGVFIAKVLKGGTEKELLDLIKKDFLSTKHVKPPASRPESTELYIVATGYRAQKD